MKKELLIVFILTTLLKVNGQNTWKMDYLTVAIPKLNIMELNNGELLTGLNQISILDQSGNQIYSSGFSFNPFIGVNSIVRITDNEYYFDGLYVDSCSLVQSQFFSLCKVDSFGNILKSKFYKMNGNCATDVEGSFDITSDNGIIKGGKTQLSGCGNCWNGHGYIVRVDSSFNVMWAKYFHNHRGFPYYVKQASDNSFMVGYNLDTAGAVLIKLSASGNIIWSKSYFRPNGYISGFLFEPDGSCVAVGATDLSATKKAFMLKVDSDGHVLWCKGFDSDGRVGPLKIISTFDNNYAIISQCETAQLSKILLIKADKNGDTLWTRAHGNYYYSYGPMNFIQSKDSGYIFSGYSQGGYPMGWGAAYFINKTDSLGHSSCNEPSIPVYVYDLFPTDSDIVMLSVDGATAYNANITPAARSGFPAYDDCTITDVMNALPFANKYSVHPNPSTGKVYIYRNDAYTSDCYYTVYNNQGKLLIQQKFIKGNKDTEINLSRYGKGIYLLKITEGVEVLTKKVVIE